MVHKSGTCKYCGKLVEWDSKEEDYFTMDSSLENICWDSPNRTEYSVVHADHVPIDKSERFKHLYNKLNS